MGTNFYIKTGRKIKKTCPTCNHTYLEEEIFHIGKSSGGRYFTLHEDTEHHLTDLKSWVNFMKKALKKPNAKIVDEYGEVHSLESMVQCITRINWKTQNGEKTIKPGTAAEFDDIFGEHNLVYHRGAKVGTDGLYIMLEGEFC